MEEQGGGFPLTPIQGTYVIGASNAIAAILAIGTIQMFGRRSILICGQLSMALCLFVCGLSVLNEWNITAFVMINLLITAYHLSQGSVAWLYIPEVTVDAASGFSVGAQFINLTILSLTFEFMINSPLKVYGSLWLFSGLSFIGFLFMIFFVREIKGLSDLEKKTLYSPKDIPMD